MEKQMIRNMFKKSEFIRIAFVASVGLPLFIATSASAQNLPGEATTTAVVVTGSNIPTAEEVTAEPVDTVTTADIDRSGAQDVLTVLQKRNPDFVGGGNIGNTNANIASGFTQGGAIISIRGLPTLTLLEGRRVADDAAIATGGAQFQDVNLFPTALISRIEVLKDGASTLYGSEAVGGVVNIFLKDDFTGVDMGYHYGFTVESAIAERKAWVIAGVGNEDTHVTAGFQYYEEDPLFSRQRAYSSGTGKGGVTGTIPGEGIDGTNGHFEILGFNPLTPFAPPTLNSPFDNPAVVAGATTPAAGFAALSGSYTNVPTSFIHTYDLSQRPTSTLDVSDTNAYASFSHQIFGKQLEVFGEFLYTHNHNLSFLNAQPISNASNPAVVILGSVRVDPVTGLQVAENRGAPAPYNPFTGSIDGASTGGGAYTLLALQRYNAFDPRTFTNDGSFYRLLGGLKSQINQDWYAEVATYYSHYSIDFVNGGLVNATAVHEINAV